MHSSQPIAINAATTEVMRAAYQRLVGEGVSPEDAETTVKRNFDRVICDPNIKLIIDELCKSHF